MSLPSTIVWRFFDFGSDPAGHSLILLTGVEANGQSLNSYAAGSVTNRILRGGGISLIYDPFTNIKIEGEVTGRRRGLSARRHGPV